MCFLLLFLFLCAEPPTREIWWTHGTERRWADPRYGLYRKKTWAFAEFRQFKRHKRGCGRHRAGIVVLLNLNAAVKNWVMIRKKEPATLFIRRSWREASRRTSFWLPWNLPSRTASRRSILIYARAINRMYLPNFVAVFWSLDGSVCWVLLRK